MTDHPDLPPGVHILTDGTMSGIPGFPGTSGITFTFCATHKIWSPVPCPACQTQWPDSPPGILCQDCIYCPHGSGEFPQQKCPHACESAVCHPGLDCQADAGKGHHV